MSPKDFVSALFHKWEKGDSSDFFSALAEDVVWTAIGHTPISGTSPSKAEYMKNTYLPLQSVFAGKTSCKVRRIIAEEDVVAVEWHGETPLAKGGIYENDYCWVVRVGQEKLIEVVGYFDTAAVDALFV
jgi:ketosteroid isomerase-like protein